MAYYFPDEENDDQSSNADNSDEEFDQTEIENDQEEEGNNSADDDNDNDSEGNDDDDEDDEDDESCEDDNGSDLESDGKFYFHCMFLQLMGVTAPMLSCSFHPFYLPLPRLSTPGSPRMNKCK